MESDRERLNMINADCRTLNFSSVDRQSVNVGFSLYIASWSIVSLYSKMEVGIVKESRLCL